MNFFTLFESPKHLLIYLNVPFSQKEIAKKNRMRWSPTVKSWYYQINIENINPEDTGIKELLFIPDDLLHFQFKFANYDKPPHNSDLETLLEKIPYEYEKLRIETLNNPKK